MRITTKKITIAALATALLVGVTIFASGHEVMAQASTIQDAVNDIGGSNATPLNSVIKTAVNVLLYIIGALSVLMIIYGGFKYVTSSGESSAVTSAKNTILYAVVGLVVAVLAFTIVNFVLGIFNDSSSGRLTDEQARYERCGNTPASSCQ